MLENRSNSRRVYELVDSGQVDVYLVMEACLDKLGEEAIGELLEHSEVFAVESIFDNQELSIFINKK